MTTSFARRGVAVAVAALTTLGGLLPAVASPAAAAVPGSAGDVLAVAGD